MNNPRERWHILVEQRKDETRKLDDAIKQAASEAMSEIDELLAEHRTTIRTTAKLIESLTQTRKLYE